MQFDIKEILSQFDQEAESFSFPMLDNGYYYHGDQKLTIYQDAKRWAMSIEVLAYNNHQLSLDGITTHISIFGNCILTEKLNDNNNFFYFAEDDQIPTFIDDDNLYISFLNPEAQNITVRNKKI